MSRVLHDQREREAVLAALRSDNPGAFTDFEFMIAGEPYGERHISTEYGRDDKERPGVTTNTSLAGEVPAADLKGEPVALDLFVNDVRLPDFRGDVVWIRSGSQSDLLAATGGYWLDKVDIGDGPQDDQDFLDADPGFVYAFAVNRVERYRRGLIEIEDVTSPPFGRKGATAFRWTDSPWQILEALWSETDWFRADTYLGGHVGRLLRSPAEAQEVVWHYRGGIDFDDDIKPEPSGQEFSSVLVTRENDGDIEPVIEVPITGSKAPARSRYKIQFTGEDDPGDAEAIYQGISAATRFMGGESTVTIEVDWVNPLVGDGDYISLDASFDEGPRYRGTRTYIAEVQSSRKVLPAKKHSLTLRMVVAREDLIEVPLVQPFGIPRVKRPLMGLDLARRFYIDDSLSFGSRIGAGRFRIDPGKMTARGIPVETLGDRGLIRIGY